MVALHFQAPISTLGSYCSVTNHAKIYWLKIIIYYCSYIWVSPECSWSSPGFSWAFLLQAAMAKQLCFSWKVYELAGATVPLFPILLGLEGWSEQVLLKAVLYGVQEWVETCNTSKQVLELAHCHLPPHAISLSLSWGQMQIQGMGKYTLPMMRPYQEWGFREEWRLEVINSIYHTIIQDPTQFLCPLQSLLVIFPSTALPPISRASHLDRLSTTKPWIILFLLAGRASLRSTHQTPSRVSKAFSSMSPPTEEVPGSGSQMAFVSFSNKVCKNSIFDTQILIRCSLLGNGQINFSYSWFTQASVIPFLNFVTPCLLRFQERIC